MPDDQPDDQPDDPLPPEFTEQLDAAFQRLVPKGNPQWGLRSNLGRLQRALVPGIGLAPRTPEETGTDRPPPGPSASARFQGVVNAGGDRVARVMVPRQARVTARDVVERATSGAWTALGEALDAIDGSLRYLTSRVEALESSVNRRRRPIEGLAWLVDPPDLMRWEGTVAAWLADAVETGLDEATPGGAPGEAPVGTVLVGECGDGQLAVTLAASGWTVTAAEPRAPAALAAAGAGVDVRVGEVAESLAAVMSGSLAGVVLAGVVDRAPLEEVLGLAETAVDRLRSGGVLVVVCESSAGWDSPALDLLPGRPLQALTWELVLRRLGLTAVVSATAPPGRRDGWAVVGRR